MDDLIAFAGARLDEDEAQANAMEHVTAESELYACPATRSEPLAGTDLEWGEENCDCGLAERKGRALREVAAKRAILADCQRAMSKQREFSAAHVRHGSPFPSPHANLAFRTLLQLATVWSVHPGYRPEWTP